MPISISLKDFPHQILFASIFLLFGILIGKFFEKISLRIFEKAKLKSVLKRVGGEDLLRLISEKFDLSNFITQIVKWFFVFFALMVAFEILNLERVSDFFQSIVNYYPNIFIAILIFLTSLYLLDFSKKIFVGTLEKEKISFAPLLGRGFSFFIWTITILAILYQLKIVPELILSVFIGFVAIVSLALGISFGLGGKNLAEKILKDLSEKLKK